jgi:tetratricopeptide (TPR) repeat protein
LLLRLVTESNQGLDAGFVLEEVAGKLGVVLWQVLRDTLLWATSSLAERAMLFAPNPKERKRLLSSVDVPATIAQAVRTLTRLPGAPNIHDVHMVQVACGNIAEWASEQNAPATAVSFARAGALAASKSGTAAANAGFTALQWRDLPRAETWLRRAARLTRHSDKTTFALARSTLGSIWSERGDLPRARSCFIQALRATKGRPDALEIRAQAAIGLFQNAIARGAHREAERAAQIALRAFGSRYPEVAMVGRQLAENWLERGQPAKALKLLRRVRHFRVSRADRVEVLTLITRAAAACGARMTLERAWRDATRILAKEPAGEDTVRMMLKLAKAGGGAVTHAHAAALVSRAAAMAQDIGQPDLIESDMALRFLRDDGHETRKG